MQPATHVENGEWFSRRAIIASAVAAWMGGFVLAGLASWQMHHSRGAPPVTDEVSVTAASAPCDVVSTDTTSAEDTLQVGTVVFLPEDVVVAPRAPRLGVTQRQKP